MPNRNTSNTMVEGLQKILSDIAQIATYPDSDLDFLSQLQSSIVGKIKQQNAVGDQQAMAQQQAQAQGAPMQAQNPGMATGGAMQGLTPTPPNMDELRRVLQGGGQQ